RAGDFTYEATINVPLADHGRVFVGGQGLGRSWSRVDGSCLSSLLRIRYLLLRGVSLLGCVGWLGRVVGLWSRPRHFRWFVAVSTLGVGLLRLSGLGGLVSCLGRRSLLG